MSSGELFSCSLSQETRGFHVCDRPVQQLHCLVACCSSVLSKYLSLIWEKKVDFPAFHSKPPMPAGLHHAWQRPGDACQHQCVDCMLRSAWLNHASGHPAVGTGQAAPGHWDLDPAVRKQSPRVLLLLSCSWHAKGGLATWPFSYKWPFVMCSKSGFQQALGSEGTIWRLANKVT